MYHLLRYKWILPERTTNVRYWPYKMSEFTIWIRSWILSASNSRFNSQLRQLSPQSQTSFSDKFSDFFWGDYNRSIPHAFGKSLVDYNILPYEWLTGPIDGGSSPRLLSSLLSAQGHIHVIGNCGVLEFLSRILRNWVYTGCLIGILDPYHVLL